MTRLITQKTNFTSGEIAPDLRGRTDLSAYANGAAQLRNVFINPTGGVRRRAGTLYRATLPARARLVAYEYSSADVFLLAFSHLRLDIYLDGVWQGNISAPWSSAQLDQISHTQSADSLFMTHPDVPPKKLTRDALGTWTIADWAYAQSISGLKIYQPYYKFAAADVTISASAATGTVTLTTSASVFHAGHVGVRLRIAGSECTVAGYLNPTQVTATVHGSLGIISGTTDWAEAAFSSLRGYPIAAVFHQDRLVIGGSRDLPNRLWMSKSGVQMNFDLGTGLDDEAISFGILSDQANAIRAVFSGRHLQVFTSGGEWMVSGDPLTPSTVQLHRQTRVGSVVDRSIAPVDVEGATLFVARNGAELREFLYTDLEQAYRATDLSLLARHVIATPVDQEYDRVRRLLFLVRADGNFATLTIFRTEGVAAWTLHTTDGAVQSAAMVGEALYLQVLRNGAYLLEELRDEIGVDSGVIGSNATPQSVWGGLTHLNGKTVRVVGDGVPQTDCVVAGGAVTIATPARQVQIGLAFAHKIVPLPPGGEGMPAGAHRVRLVRLRARVQDSSTLRLDVGRGWRRLALPGVAPPVTYSGDVVVDAYGWTTDLNAPLWQMEDDTPLAFFLLSIVNEMNVN